MLKPLLYPSSIRFVFLLFYLFYALMHKSDPLLLLLLLLLLYNSSILDIEHSPYYIAQSDLVTTNTVIYIFICIQNKRDSYASNPFAYVEFPHDCVVEFLAGFYASQVSIPASSISRVQPHWWVVTERNSLSVDDNIYAPPLGGWALLQRNNRLPLA